MSLRLAGMMSAATVLLLAAMQAAAQPAPPPPPPPSTAPSAAATGSQASPAQLYDLVAPVALYPDELLSQILMAASYPTEVVQAGRWLQDPSTASLSGQELYMMVDLQAWDPSVKSLTPFPGILRMMNDHMEWTESLGEAFVANQVAVMDAVQDLRHRAMAAGALRSNARVTVTVDANIIRIEPAGMPGGGPDGDQPPLQPVDYPVYDPSTAYGPWAYPDAPPYDFNEVADGCAMGDFGFCWFDVGIAGGFWGWNSMDWRNHRLNLDPGRFAGLNNHRPSAGGSTWVHETGHRHGVPYQDAGGLSREIGARDMGAADLVGANRADRGFPDGRTGLRMPSESSFYGPAEHGPASFESFGDGGLARAEELRGSHSRMSGASYGSRGGSRGRSGSSHGGHAR
jgi:hypothetical protein